MSMHFTERDALTFYKFFLVVVLVVYVSTVDMLDLKFIYIFW